MSELNARSEQAARLLEAIVDIYDDERNNAPEDRCYVESAWAETLADIREFLRAAPPVVDHAAKPTATPVLWTEDEREKFLRVCDEFEDCGEADAAYELLMRWVDAGLMECDHFRLTKKGENARKGALAIRSAQPRFPQTYCSSCGKSLGAGSEGVSSCGDHK